MFEPDLHIDTIKSKARKFPLGIGPQSGERLMAEDIAIGVLKQAAEAERQELAGYERPSEVLAFETLRSLDDLYCRDLFPEGKDGGEKPEVEQMVMSWGVNDALRRIMPDSFSTGDFRLFPSTADTGVRADDFIFRCGVVSKAERTIAWLEEGLLGSELKELPSDPVISQKWLIILRPTNPSVWAEAIGHRGGRWASSQIQNADRSFEEELERRHLDILPDLTKRIDVLEGWSITYESERSIDDYFLEWARLYLRRMLYTEMLDPDDTIGGRPFRDYLAVLSALSGRAQLQLCAAGLLKHRRADLNLRNLLTMVMPFEVLTQILASRLDSTTLDIQRLASHLTLEPANKHVHLATSDTAWAPLVRASTHNFILPLYGLEVNPFLFLLNDLRGRYPKDWFRLANLREDRWIREIAYLFPAPRWMVTSRSVKLRDGKDEVTDIDFAAYDTETGDLAVFQLKWQQPVSADSSARWSTGKNLTSTSNKWIEAVVRWLDKHGTHEMAARLGWNGSRISAVTMFVLGRYHAFFSGHEHRASGATWSDWHHFQKVRMEAPNSSPFELAELISSEIGRARTEERGESFAFPVGDVALLVNPSKVP